jgi:hypothetical protein
MRVCDRHPGVAANTTVVLADSQERFDVCEACNTEIREYFLGVSKKLEPKATDKPKRSILGLKINT